ncbi:MAG: iron-containing alcohol dehydrogenase family protein [Geminocystis sp.]|nr:iron-containing alcohol dehydrogenase family protein [Geminocystis sp.]MCS7146731.1 iron-containing alcohol dehydrogenase family protein [Geminocystis sp.]MCX8077119.1 iron-containing alcohol dehydrogenase family protein [Geminocystis sp.]MDW8115557.1 iron-containing alcohol dehydrogenase family protein [Geminocystis sp.]HIK36523.1 iron-containing alcohol dehydrogenase family protein [Geminocystis sp. M7585_C2015_104]
MTESKSAFSQQSQQTTQASQLNQILHLQVAPGRIVKGENCLAVSGDVITTLGKRFLVVGGENSLSVVKPRLQFLETEYDCHCHYQSYYPDCCEHTIERLCQEVKSHQADAVIGAGGGKALDAAKLVAQKCQLPVVTIPTSAATCAAWTALSNIYSDKGAFQYDVPLSQCPNVLILDYNLVATAPRATLAAGIGDALAKWYESSVSSGNSTASLTIAAVQQARVLRDILFQKAEEALAHPLTPTWKEVVDATVLLAGISGGLGGASCRTVGAHAVHNALTYFPETRRHLHGAKVAYGILVQLRLEEIIGHSQLAATARKQLLKFYKVIGLPSTLEELSLNNITLGQLRQCAEIACKPESDIHRLPFPVTVDNVVMAMVSTTID